MITLNQLINIVADMNRRMLALEEQIQAVMPSSGEKLMLDHPVVDGMHAGRLSDVFEHGSKSPFDEQQQSILCDKAQAHYHIDPSGRIGRDQKVIVEDSTGEWVAVDAYVK